jgi:hypothetical protein
LADGYFVFQIVSILRVLGYLSSYFGKSLIIEKDTTFKGRRIVMGRGSGMFWAGSPELSQAVEVEFRGVIESVVSLQQAPSWRRQSRGEEQSKLSSTESLTLRRLEERVAQPARSPTVVLPMAQSWWLSCRWKVLPWPTMCPSSCVVDENVVATRTMPYHLQEGTINIYMSNVAAAGTGYAGALVALQFPCNTVSAKQVDGANDIGH